ncbi:glycoside hydrolase family 73 protein [Bombilactobacillus bombi]|uniref:glycoside hydrolase family 73 protein n=1 Tax=Bombilactobacillus bombi TaxID=1303590 RepID=UPI0035EBC692
MKKKLVTSTLVAAILAGAGTATLAGSVQAATDNGIAHPAVTATPALSTKAVTYAAPHNSEQQFIQTIAPVAQQAANQYNLYPSVMMAQAILESGWGASQASQAPNYNFFGIKGDYNGASFNMPTKEWSKEKGYYTIDSYFRKYPNMAASFMDNGNKLRNGLSWNSAYYSGTWRENTTSYKDATAWLQGRYATDPSYASKLNNLIETYNLTQYDGNGTQTETVSSSATDPNNDVHVVRVNGGQRFVHLYTPLGVSIADRVLPANTDWRSDQTRLINNERFYRVSTYEWVKASDVAVIK